MESCWGVQAWFIALNCIYSKKALEMRTKNGTIYLWKETKKIN